MRKSIKKYLFTFSFLLLSLIVFSLIIVILKFNTNMTYKTLKTISLIGSSIFFLISSILNGKIHKKRGLINGVLMTSIYLIIVFIIKLFNVDITISSIIIKIILIIVGNIIGVNL